MERRVLGPTDYPTRKAIAFQATQTFVPLNIDGSSDTSAQGVNDNCAIVGFHVDPTTSSFNGYYVRFSSCQWAQSSKLSDGIERFVRAGSFKSQTPSQSHPAYPPPASAPAVHLA
jgi:hypothetical protein